MKHIDATDKRRKRFCVCICVKGHFEYLMRLNSPHTLTFSLLCLRSHRAETLSNAFVLRLTSVCLTYDCLSVAYVGPNSRTERPRKTKIGTEVAHVTRD